MTAFEIYINDSKVCLAGLPDAGVVSAILNWIKGAEENDEERSELRIGGLISKFRTFVDWYEQPLEMGDEVRFKVCERKKVSKPKSRRKESVAQQKSTSWMRLNS